MGDVPCHLSTGPAGFCLWAVGTLPSLTLQPYTCCKLGPEI